MAGARDGWAWRCCRPTGGAEPAVQIEKRNNTGRLCAISSSARRHARHHHGGRLKLHPSRARSSTAYVGLLPRPPGAQAAGDCPPRLPAPDHFELLRKIAVISRSAASMCAIRFRPSIPGNFRNGAVRAGATTPAATLESFWRRRWKTASSTRSDRRRILSRAMVGFWKLRRRMSRGAEAGRRARSRTRLGAGGSRCPPSSKKQWAVVQADPGLASVRSAISVTAYSLHVSQPSRAANTPISFLGRWCTMSIGGVPLVLRDGRIDLRRLRHRRAQRDDCLR